MSNLFITTANSNANNTSVVGIDPAQSTSLWHPVPWEKKNEVQAGCVLFAVNLQLTQASATNQEGHIVLQGNNVKDVWLGGNESNNKETGRIQDRNCLSHWQDQDIIDDNAKHTIMINSTKKDGVLTKACIELSHGKNIVQPKPRLVTNSTRSFWKKKTCFPKQTCWYFWWSACSFPIFGSLSSG